jgi:hypothetical protein
MLSFIRPDFEGVKYGRILLSGSSPDGATRKSTTYHENKISGFCFLLGSCWVFAEFNIVCLKINKGWW